MTSAEPAAAPGVVSLTDYARIARRRWRAILAGLLIGVLGAAGWYEVAPRSYEAGATVTIAPITNDLFSSTPVNQLVNTATETEVVQSIEIAQRAAAEHDLSGDPRDLLERLTVTVPQQSLAIALTFVADDADAAADGANAFATAYLDFRAETAEARRAGYAEQLRGQLDALSEQLAELDEDAEQREILSQQIVVLRQQLADATSLPISAGQLVSRALPPRFASSPNRLAVGGSGLVIGMLLGIVIAAARHRRDDRLFTPDEVASSAGLPVIGRLPALDRGPRLHAREADDLALTTMRLTSTAFGPGPRSWVVVRADMGRPTRAEVIAWRLGQRHDVVLVDLCDAADMPAAQRWDLSTLPDSPGLREASQAAGATDGYVVLDGSGLNGLADAIAIPEADAVLVTVELGVTRRRDLERTIGELLQISPSHLAPGVLAIERRSLLSRLRPNRRTPRHRHQPTDGTGRQPALPRSNGVSRPVQPTPKATERAT